MRGDGGQRLVLVDAFRVGTVATTNGIAKAIDQRIRGDAGKATLWAGVTSGHAPPERRIPRLGKLRGSPDRHLRTGPGSAGVSVPSGFRGRWSLGPRTSRRLVSYAHLAGLTGCRRHSIWHNPCSGWTRRRIRRDSAADEVRVCGQSAAMATIVKWISHPVRWARCGGRRRNAEERSRRAERCDPCGNDEVVSESRVSNVPRSRRVGEQLGRGEIRLLVEHDDGEVVQRHTGHVFLGFQLYSEGLPRLFPWAQLNVDECFYDEAEHDI
jgi:hypothetical protein